jgi:peptidoglycan/LPS O-acetylase OafA/YrhL
VPFFHDRFTMQWAQPWLIAQFAFGMAAAALVFPKHTPKRFLKLDRIALRIAQHPLTLLLLLAMVYKVGLFKRVPLTFLCGAITVCIILHGMTATWLGKRIVRVFESRFCLWLGLISFSLYLLHTPIQMLFQRAMEPYHLPALVRFALLIVVGTPLSILGGMAGYRFCEQPFIRRGKPGDEPLEQFGPAADSVAAVTV